MNRIRCVGLAQRMIKTPARAGKAALWRYRLLTSGARSLPDFIIIGAQRCGTTSLYNYLIQHPCVSPAYRKEIHFFDNNFSKGVGWYRSHFPSLVYRLCVRRVLNRDPVAGEATPYYIFHPRAPRRLMQTVPAARLIVLLRDPVDRAYSHYHHQVRMGSEDLSFEQAIEREAARLGDEAPRMLEDEHYSSHSHQSYSYLSRGLYARQLERWLRFFPREQFLVLQSEGFYREPSAAFTRVLAFLGLRPWQPKHYKRYERGRYGPMRGATRRRLVSHFERHNRRLYDLLGVDFGWGDPSARTDR